MFVTTNISVKYCTYFVFDLVFSLKFCNHGRQAKFGVLLSLLIDIVLFGFSKLSVFSFYIHRVYVHGRLEISILPHTNNPEKGKGGGKEKDKEETQKNYLFESFNFGGDTWSYKALVITFLRCLLDDKHAVKMPMHAIGYFWFFLKNSIHHVFHNSCF